MTNKLVGTFTGLIILSAGPAGLFPPMTSSRRKRLRASWDPFQVRHPLMLTLTLTVLLGSVLLLNTNTEVNATQYSLTLSIDNPTPTVNVSPTVSGAFAKSDDVTISAGTTNATGYTLSIKGANNNYNQLINLSGDSSSNSNNNGYLTSITTATTEEQFKALDSTAYNNKWGYLPSKLNSSANTSFLPAPNATTGDIIETTNTANTIKDSTATNACAKYDCHTYTLSLGARVDTDSTIGAYANTYIVTLVAEAVPYTITYDDNVVANMPADVSDKTSSSTVNISSNVPTRDGYTFLGWCSVAIADPVTSASACTTAGGTIYNPNGTGTDLAWTIDQEGTNNLHLYSMWSKNTYLQHWNGCGDMTIGGTITLPDIRDGEQYLVGKLADGKCWMLDNLRLGSNSTIKLTPEDTNINNDFTLPANNYSGTPATYITPQINTNYKETVVRSYGNGGGKVGVYYNYCAVSAGIYCYAQSAGTSNLNYDICPAGWRLPTGGSNGEYASLYAAYDSNVANFRFALSLALSGYSQGGTSANRQNEVGYYWSSILHNNSEMKTLRVDANSVNPSDSILRDRNLTVRCLLK